MRVFKVADGTSWVAKLDEMENRPSAERRAGWEAVMFLTDSDALKQRLVYRPAGWLQGATLDELVTALEEGVAVRTRWGE